MDVYHQCQLSDNYGFVAKVSIFMECVFPFWSVFIFLKLFDDIDANHHILIVGVYMKLSAHLNRVTDALEKDTYDASKSIKIFVISLLFNFNLGQRTFFKNKNSRIFIYCSFLRKVF